MQRKNCLFLFPETGGERVSVQFGTDIPQTGDSAVPTPEKLTDVLYTVTSMDAFEINPALKPGLAFQFIERLLRKLDIGVRVCNLNTRAAETGGSQER